MGSESAWLHSRLLKQFISFFPEEKRGGIWLTAGIWYIRYFQFMRLITLGLYGRPVQRKETTPRPQAEESGNPQQTESRGCSPHPASQYDQQLSYEEWIEESIHFFRSIGFFDNFQGLEDHEVLNRLHETREKALRDVWDKVEENEATDDSWILETKDASGASSTTLHSDPEAHPGSVPYAEYMRRERQEMIDRIPVDRMFDRKNALQDLWIAAEDETRVWYSDLEVGAGPEADEYVEALREWGRISRGVFELKDIRESWNAIDEHLYHLSIRFQWKGSPHAIELDTPLEWINLEVLEAVNKLICETGIQLHTHVSFDQCAYIVSLTAEEKRALEQKRGWKFSA
jgi:hypothetical protein